MADQLFSAPVMKLRQVKAARARSVQRVHVYLAGKIDAWEEEGEKVTYTRGDWRSRMIGYARHGGIRAMGEQGYPALDDAQVGPIIRASRQVEWVYAGPWCNGCSHVPLGGSHSCHDGKARVFARNMTTMLFADIVFAFIDSLTCYGTLLEIGAFWHLRASGRQHRREQNKNLWICYHPRIADNGTDDPSELWYVTMAAGKVDVCEDPAAVFDRWAGEFEAQFDRPVFESPIEQALWEALPPSLRQACETQYSIGAYRIDIAFPSVRLAVECDGHNYHKSKKARTHDAKRDRYLKAEGWETIRFTGTEIYQDPAQCAGEVARFVEHIAQTTP